MHYYQSIIFSSKISKQTRPKTNFPIHVEQKRLPKYVSLLRKLYLFQLIMSRFHLGLFLTSSFAAVSGSLLSPATEAQIPEITQLVREVVLQHEDARERAFGTTTTELNKDQFFARSLTLPNGETVHLGFVRVGSNLRWEKLAESRSRRMDRLGDEEDLSYEYGWEQDEDDLEGLEDEDDLEAPPREGGLFDPPVVSHRGGFAPPTEQPPPPSRHARGRPDNRRGSQHTTDWDVATYAEHYIQKASNLLRRGACPNYSPFTENRVAHKVFDRNWDWFQRADIAPLYEQRPRGHEYSQLGMFFVFISKKPFLYEVESEYGGTEVVRDGLVLASTRTGIFISKHAI